MAEVGFTSSAISFYRLLKDIYDEVMRLRRNSKRSTDFTTQIDKLLNILKTTPRISGPAEDLVGSVLEEVNKTLASLPEARKIAYLPKPCSSLYSARRKADKLDEIEEKLKSLTLQVVVVGSICQLRKELPSVWNASYAPPKCPVGLDRAEEVLEFLQTRAGAGEELRVVGIHGLSGVGKTTLLHCVWNRVTSTEQFAARAHVQIGSSVSDKGICKLQSVIFEQLSGGKLLTFTAPEGGKAKLSEHLQQLKENKKPVFLAMDNVLEGRDLTRLLPATLSQDIPGSSVIAITCRTFPVVRDLLRLCQLDQQKNVSQIYLFSPSCLNPADSKALFAQCGGLSYDADAALLESLVPLCGGFPLALDVLGGLFADSAKRSEEEWELIKAQMERLDGDGTDTAPVTKALQVTYDQLSEKRKAAFCEVVMCFYGWNWERVERIMGRSVLNNFKESSLISEAEHWSTCNQSALSEGFDMDQWRAFRGDRRAVTMHDLTWRFGQDLCANLLVMRMIGSRALRGCFQRLEASKLRHLILWRENHQDDPKLEFLEEAANLQTLYLSGGLYQSGCVPLLKASSYRNVLSTDERSFLHFLRLEDWKSSEIIMKSKLSNPCEIREIHLYGCRNVERLPDVRLPKLEVLSIHRCGNFQDFSPSSVRSWGSLKYLQVVGCNRLTSVPADLGRLKKLFDLRIEACSSLQALPTLSCPLQKLHLAHIPIANFELKETACLHLREVYLEANNLESLPSSVCNASSLKMLSVFVLDKFKELLPAIGSASSLQSLTLRAFELVQLPEDVGNLAVLTKLDLSSCLSLKGLPQSIGNATSLQALILRECGSLVELPDEVGRLTALAELDLRCCTSLKRLPPTIGKAISLRALKLGGCESLVGLPDEVGELAVLTELDLSGCKSLKGLPSAILNAASLQALKLGGRESHMVELLEEVGKLMALTELNLSGCKSLNRLPSVLGNVASLRALLLDGCDSLIELPDEVGKLSALTKVSLSRCLSFKRLPPAIGNAMSLRVLHLGSHSLVELPDEVGRLVALTELNLGGCKILKGLPSAIGNAASLQVLKLRGCESLVELPDQVGELGALTVLDLSWCRRLKGLPSAIGNAVSLGVLTLWMCEELEELPEEVGKLTALTELTLTDCKSLKKLPQAIGNAVSLQILMLDGCERVVELPDEVGKLVVLTELNLNKCKSLRGLPSAIGNAESLQRLFLQDCESLVELPDEVGQLPNLIILSLSKCKRLKGLPPAVWNAPSLSTLILRECESFKELPDEVEKLMEFIQVDFSGCKSLKGILPSMGTSRLISYLVSRLISFLVYLKRRFFAEMES